MEVDGFVTTEALREKLRNYSAQQRTRSRENASDATRFGLGEIKEKIEELENLTEKDVKGLAARIKRRRHATEDDMFRLSHAFLQSEDNIKEFDRTPGAIDVIIKELTGNDSIRQLSAIECLCNFSLGSEHANEKLAKKAGCYLVIYLSSYAEPLVRTSLWTIANILSTGLKGGSILIDMEIVSQLWKLYTSDSAAVDYCEDAAICLQIISQKSQEFLRPKDIQYLQNHICEKKPRSSASEYHLQILFNCNIINPNYQLKPEEVGYLVNYALTNLHDTPDFHDNVNRLKILFGIRVLANLIATQPVAYDAVLQELINVWKTDLAQVFNKLFGFEQVKITKEILWLLRTVLEVQKERQCDMEQLDTLISQLKISSASIPELAADDTVS